MYENHPETTASRIVKQEQKTIGAMLKIYCGDIHGNTSGLCTDCSILQQYALERIARCKFKLHRLVCSACPVHCYKPEFREKIRTIMRYAGPRMLFRYPLMALRHLWHKKMSSKAKKRLYLSQH